MPQPSADSTRAVRLRWAAIGATAFVVLYALHRVLQGLGPDSAEPAALADWITSDRVPLLASELALGVALLSFVVFIAPLAVVLRDDGDAVVAAALAIVGAVFIAMGLVSLAAETALFAADSADADLIAVLDALQARVPNVLAGAALAASIAPAFLRRRLRWHWLGIVSVAAAALFLLAFVFSVAGSGAETRGSILGVAVFVVWMALVAAALWRSIRVDPAISSRRRHTDRS